MSEKQTITHKEIGFNPVDAGMTKPEVLLYQALFNRHKAGIVTTSADLADELSRGQANCYKTLMALQDKGFVQRYNRIYWKIKEAPNS